MENIVVIGSSGALGSEYVRQLALAYPHATIHAFTRNPTEMKQQNVQQHTIDYTDEQSIANAANIAAATKPLELIIVATGILHDGDIQPEKSLRDISAAKFQHLYAVNAILPALIAKHFLPQVAKDKRVVFAAMSARIGSISDNRLGGWYAYRAAKAALNMILKTTAIEMSRSHKNAIIVGLHPGTVDSHLSKPFQKNVPELFTPEYSVAGLLNVLANITIADSGKCFAWDGEEIEP